MNEGTVRQHCRISKDWKTNVHFEQRSGRPSVVSDDLVQSVDQKICESRRFTNSEVSCELPQISRILVYEIMTHKFCARCVPKMLKGAQKTQRMTTAFTCLQRYYKDGDEFLSHVVRITGDETWVSFVNVETKEESKQWMHTHSPNKPRILNERCLPARKLMATVFWDRKGVLMVEFMQKGTTITSDVYCETRKKTA
jgi:hypothetical protein